jgi:F0F1-type ATP synthase membrane subunit c/vacuolar-type H+-ATPase subunit K
MSPIALSSLAFALMVLGILVGGWVQGKLPEGHQSSDSKEVVKLSLGIMGTLAALVLGLLVANAQSSYAARESEVKQLTAYVILLDHLLDQYGKDAESVRVSLRDVVPTPRKRDSFFFRIWEAQSPLSFWPCCYSGSQSCSEVLRFWRVPM